MKFFVGNLHYDVTSESLRDAFSEHGEVVSSSVISDRETGRSKGFGFVEVKGDGAKVMEAMDGVAVMGREIRVSEAHRQ